MRPRLVPVLLLLPLVFPSESCMRSRAEAGSKRSPVVKLRCPNNIEVTADQRSSAAFVNWDRRNFEIEATHSIKGIYQTVPIYGASTTVQRAFHEGTHYVEYKAVDESGNFDSCSFSVTVNVIRCPKLYNPQFGLLTCDSNSLYGSRCSLTCIPGYATVGNTQVECLRDKIWSAEIPFCRTTTCPDPGTPLHGTRFCTTATHAYGSICSFACSRGYQLVGPSRLICKSDNGRTYWASETPLCQEITPPKTEQCPATIQVTSSGLAAEVKEPQVVFRTAKGEIAPHTCTHFGSYGKYNFSLGQHSVTCRAYDPEFGDEATAICHFFVNVRPNPCQPLPQPANGFLLCSRAHGGGTDLRDSCRLFCNKGFALPSYNMKQVSFDCDHTGQWQPSSIVPSCVRPSRPQELKLPSEIFYSSNNCTGSSQLNAVRIKFQSSLQMVIRTQAACETSPGDCIVEDVITTCQRHPEAPLSLHRSARYVPRQPSGTNAGLARRNIPGAEFILPIQFHFGTRVPASGGSWPDEYHKASHRLYAMFEFFERHVMDGAFSIRQLVTGLNLAPMQDSLTFAHVLAICDISYKFNTEILLCVTCGAGSYYDMSKDECIPCELGSYQNRQAELNCVPCPDGTTTILLGSTNISQCIEVDECESSPCLHGGQCQDGPASYFCVCRPGYSGQNCEDRVYDCSDHACQNGGSCMPTGRNNYTCSCRSSYSGEYCQFHTVNGGWSDWSDWAACSKSCEGGVMTRNRTCNSPTPSHGGRPCDGAPTEEKVCNIHQCPSCKRLRRPYQGTMSCISHGDYVSCSIRCRDGYAFSGPVFPVYTCGPNTSYLWPHESPDNPRCVLPACTLKSEASEAHYEFQADVALPCSNSHQQEELARQISRRAADLTEELHCLRQGTCTINQPTVTGCSMDSLGEEEDGGGRRRRKRQAEKVHIEVTITYHGDKDPPDAYQATVDEFLELGERLVQKTSTGDLYLEVDGKRVPVEANETSATNTLMCPAGMMPAFEGDYCVECSPGSFFNTSTRTCALCPEGSFQPLPAQLTCLLCPDAKTTFGRGAVFDMECYANGTNPPSIPENMIEYLEYGRAQHAYIVIPVVIVCIVLIIVGTFLALFLYKRHKKRQYDVIQRSSKCLEEIAEELQLTSDMDRKTDESWDPDC